MTATIETARAHLAAQRGQQVQRLLEVTIGDYSASNVDAEHCVIRGVKILGKESRNGRSYSEKALQSAAELYEGVDVFFDHRASGTATERGFSEGFATLKGCKVDTQKGAVFGDLHYLASHPLKEMVLERIERNMRFGLSHDAEGEISPSAGGSIVVDDIKRVHSVDIVLNPATNVGLFESVLANTEVKPMPRQVVAVLKEAAKQDKRAARLLEMEDVMDLPVEADLAVEPASGEESAQVDAAAASLIVSVIQDPSIPPDETKKKVNKIMDALAPAEEEAPVAEMEDEEAQPEEEDKMEESMKVLRDELKALREELAAKVDEFKQQAGRPNVRSLREQFSEPVSGTLADFLKKKSGR